MRNIKAKKRKIFELSTEDKELFRNAVKDVNPIEQDKNIPPPSTKIRLKRRIHSQPIENFRYTGEIMLEKLSPEEWLTPENSIQFSQGEIPRRTRKNLKRGNISLDSTLDLHGYTGDEAIKALARCLSRSQSKGWRMLLIIHGKSHVAGQHGPILKNIVHQWLKQQPEVLSIQSAQAKHGGNGAVYVLLRRQKE